MTPVHIPSLRWALCAMLADTAYAEAEKDRPNVERRLDEAGWSAQTCTQLKALALRWASKQGDDVHVTMRKAFGEEISVQEEEMLPSQARLRSTDRQFTTTLEKVAAMSTLAATLDNDKRAIVRPEDGPVSELYGDVLEERLQRVEQAMHEEPYWFSHDQKRLTRAIALIREGKVSRDRWGIYHVTGSKGTIYDIDKECPCDQGQKGKSKWCYHLVATAAHRKLYADFPTEAPSLFPTTDAHTEEVPMATTLTSDPYIPEPDDIPDPPTRSAAMPLESPTVPTEPQDDPTPVLAPQTALAPQQNQKTGISMAPAVVPIEDLPVPGPCAFVAQDRIERSATVSRLMVALARAQQAMQNPACDTNNPHFRNRYASLAAVRDAVTPALTAEGIALTQLVSSEDNAVLCTTGLWHASGEYLCSTLRLPVTKADAQSYGSALTYARRYALMGICNVAGDDDDDGEKVRDTGATARPASQTTPALSGDLRADIWKLLQGQGFRGQRDEARARVLEWTGLDLEPANFAAIISKLQQRARTAAREE